MIAGTCKFCGCQENAPCEFGCGWADDDQTLCTQCEYSATVARELVKILGIINTPKAALRISTARFELLDHESQRVLVMTIRATVEGIRTSVAEVLTTDAVEAVVEMNAIAGAVLEFCPTELGEDDQLSDVVRRVLERHAEKRIHLAGV